MVDEELLARRIAFIRKIVSGSGDIGKTKIQKIMYFLQESVGVPLLYPFRMHYYGPYSDELDGVLSFTKSLGYIDINPDPNGFGYHVTPVEQNDGMSWPEYNISNDPEVKNLSGVIDTAIAALESLDTPKIELYATIHFIGGPKGNSSKKQTFETVKRLKPKFTTHEIGDAYRTLKGSNLI